MFWVGMAIGAVAGIGKHIFNKSPDKDKSAGGFLKAALGGAFGGGGGSSGPSSETPVARLFSATGIGGGSTGAGGLGSIFGGLGSFLA